MIDVRVLRGSAIRDNAGTRGEILNVSLPWLKVGWWDEGSGTPRVEAFLRSDPRVSSIEILTLNAGWVPVSQLVGIKEDTDEPSPPSLTEDLEGLLLEKPRSPFKTASSIGPGPRHGWGKKGGAKHKKRDYWDCSGSGYVYICKGKEGENKTVRVKAAWKKIYNKQYKAWHKARLDVAAPSRILKRQAKKGAAKKKGRLSKIKARAKALKKKG